MRIGELGQATGVDVETIRFYEKTRWRTSAGWSNSWHAQVLIVVISTT